MRTVVSYMPYSCIDSCIFHSILLPNILNLDLSVFINVRGLLPYVTIGLTSVFTIYILFPGQKLEFKIP